MRLIDRFRLGALLALTMVLVTGVFSHVKSYAAEKGADAVACIIKSVQFDTEGSEPVLRVSTSVAATYTSYKSSSPSRLVVDFSQAAPDESLAALAISQGPVKAVTVKRYDTDAGVLTRMEVFLSHDLDPVITPVPEKSGELKVTFPGYKAAVVAPAGSQPPAESGVQPPPAVSEHKKDVAESQPAVPAIEHKDEKTPSSVELVLSDIQVVADAVQVVTGAAVNDYKVFKLNKPERVVLDIPGAKNSMPVKLVQLNVAGVSTVRVGAYADKVRLVFDALNSNLSEPAVEKTSQGLKLSFPEKSVDAKPVASAPTADQAAVVKPKPVSSDALAPAEEPKKEMVKSEAKPAKAAPIKMPVKKLLTQIEGIDFQVLDGVSRITIKAHEISTGEPVKTAKQISLKLNNAAISRQLQRTLETREFVTPVLKIIPVQLKDKRTSNVLIKVLLKTPADAIIKKEADVVYLDIKHPAGFGKPENGEVRAGSQKAASANVAPVVSKPVPVEQVVLVGAESGKQRYTGRKVTLEFADAEVRKIFQLLSEVSNKNFVLGDEVTGTISLKLVNIPWDQALEVILETKGLDKREEGNIVLIRGKGKFKSQMDEEIELHKAKIKAAPLATEIFDVNYANLSEIVAQFNAVKTERGIITKDERTNKIIVKDVRSVLADMRVLLKTLDLPERQVVIEARIVEAQTSFTRSLGVNWGLHYRDGSASILGVNSMDTTFGGITSAPATSGVATTAGGAAGISFGTLASNIKLDLRMSAAVTAGMLKIVSTPRIATLNNKQAKISQGYEVPYQTIDDKGNPKIEFKKVDLLLEVTPNINPNGTVNLKVNAKNNNIVPGSTAATGVAITTKEASTEMLLKDGDTTVIGGIFIDSENDTEDGVPFLNELPFIGGLFKSSEKKKTRNELLIFITPRIMNINN